MEDHADTTIWEGFIDNLQAVIDQIRDGEGRADVQDDFDYKAFWKKLGDVYKAVSHEATKLSLSFSKPPRPHNDECESLIKSVEKTVLALLHVYSNLPKAAGLTLRKTMKQSVTQIVDGIKQLAEAIKRYEGGSTEQFRSTGLVWEEVDQFSSLPQDNKCAVVKLIEQNIPMVDDAHNELSEALDCDEDDDGLDQFLGISNSSSQNDHQWSESDKTCIQYCLGLIKCSKSLLKKTKTAVSVNGDCSCEVNVCQLDDIADHVERLSPAVDELASCIYPPFRCAVVGEKATEVEKANRDMLAFLRQSHVTTEDDQRWVEFLNKANTHNKNKLTGSMAAT